MLKKCIGLALRAQKVQYRRVVPGELFVRRVASGGVKTTTVEHKSTVMSRRVDRQSLLVREADDVHSEAWWHELLDLFPAILLADCISSLFFCLGFAESTTVRLLVLTLLLHEAFESALNNA